MKNLNKEYMETKLKFKTERSFAYSGGDTTGEPVGIHIIKSGWRQPVLYHVIIEFGDMDKADHHILSVEQIKEQWGIEIEDDRDYGQMIMTIPNDSELGKEMRLHYLKNLK
jgi:hypothetical protein